MKEPRVEQQVDPVETTDDAFLGGRLMLLQPRTGYRAGIDAVFLAASLACGAPARVLDIGAGVGTVGLCVAARCPHASVVLFEREPQLAALARDNVVRNGLADRVQVVETGIGATTDALNAVGLAADSFDHVLANPPYHATGHGTEAPDALRAVSHAMAADALDDWVRFMARMVRSSGTATMVHKASALPAILDCYTRRFGAIRVLPLHPRAGEPAHRILVRGTKGSRAPLTLLPGFVLHQDAEFTAQATAVLRDGAGILMGE